jgi:hypothetical protein
MPSSLIVIYSRIFTVRWESKQPSPQFTTPIKWSCQKRKCTDILSNKKILEDQLKGKWRVEFPRVVWSHNASVSRATNSTPFKLLYGKELVTPEEIKF